MKDILGDLQVKIIYSSRKTISIQLTVEGIIIRAPKATSREKIYAILNQKKNWIEKHRKKMEEERKISEEHIPYSADEIRELARRACKIIPEKVRYYAPLVGVDYGKITIRNQQTRWGSCSHKGNLNFNCILMLMPDEVIDSVVVHELCHRKQMNHSADFYAEVKRVFPEYDRCNKWLKDNGWRYLRNRVSSVK